MQVLERPRGEYGTGWRTRTTRIDRASAVHPLSQRGKPVEQLLLQLTRVPFRIIIRLQLSTHTITLPTGRINIRMQPDDELVLSALAQHPY